MTSHEKKDESASLSDIDWKCEFRKGGPEGFEYAVYAGVNIIAWVKRKKDAENIIQAKKDVRWLLAKIRALQKAIREIELTRFGG